jgi:hypothetical protein
MPSYHTTLASYCKKKYDFENRIMYYFRICSTYYFARNVTIINRQGIKMKYPINRLIGRKGGEERGRGRTKTDDAEKENVLKKP